MRDLVMSIAKSNCISKWCKDVFKSYKQHKDRKKTAYLEKRWDQKLRGLRK